MVRRSWVLGVPGRPTVWMIVGQWPIALAVCAGGGCLPIFTFSYLFSPLSPSPWVTARYRLKYCLKGPLNQNPPPPPQKKKKKKKKTVYSSITGNTNTLHKKVFVLIFYDKPAMGYLITVFKYFI